MPGVIEESFTFRLHEHPDYQWTPRLSAIEFQKMLSNITAIKIRGAYNPGGACCTKQSIQNSHFPS